MLTVDELIAVIKMEQALGGPMRPDDCPTVMRMGGHVHPRYPATVPTDPAPPSEPIALPAPDPDDESDPF